MANPQKPAKRRHIMYDAYEIAEDGMKTFEQEDTLSEFEIGNSRMGLGIILTMAFLVGIWGTICLINGLASNNSFRELGSGLITALTGL